MATKEKSEQDGQAKDQEVLAWRQKIEQEYTYCMISTLNQMVNYLPMLLFDFKLPKMYVTLKDSELNRIFDRNLKETCQNTGGNDIGNRFAKPQEDIIIADADVNGVSNIQAALYKESKGKKVLWNITGGQRPFVMAVFELLKAPERKDDLVIYLEGNSGKPTFLEVEEGKLKKIEPDTHGFERYKIDHDQWLTIPIALQLMGFNDGEKGAVNYTSWLNSAKDDEAKPYLSLRDKISKNEHLQKKLLALNKENVPDGFRTKEVLNDPKETHQYFSELDQDERCLLLKHARNPYAFGLLLEELFAYSIWEVAKGYIADMGVNIRLRYDDEKADEKAGKKQIDELDIAILTKAGQFAVFEVKSGDMHSDVAKSTKYTTYAIAGVYGKPILLTPLLRDQLMNLDKLNDDSLYEASAVAVRAAHRPHLLHIALHGLCKYDFETAIKKLLNIKSIS